MSQKIAWWQRGAIKGVLNANERLTYYVRHGDYIGRSASYFSLLILLILLIRMMLTRLAKKTAPPS
jgi:apolipoprotein N-acyltransferase